MSKRILIVDDEKDIAQMLRDYFTLNGYEAFCAYSGEEAEKRLSLRPDLILMDVNMPGMDGFRLCLRIRDHVDCPILFLTAKVEEEDRLRGFEMGGDDYILKPFSIHELGARVAAHLRREERSKRQKPALFAGDLVVDDEQKTVSIAGKTLPLARKEYDILLLLLRRPGMVFSKDRIYESLWEPQSEGDSAVVAEHIRRLRQKLGPAASHIATVWGMGYKWEKEKQAAAAPKSGFAAGCATGR